MSVAVGLSQPKMAQVIASGLRADIASGKLANGKRLPSEAELIAHYGVSRAVVREALRLLESAGLVVVRRGPKGGAVVTDGTTGVVRDTLLLSLQLSDVRLGQVYDCLAAILPGAARLAAAHRPAETAAALRAHTAAQSADAADLHQLNLQGHDFNKIMLSNCGNQALHLLATSLFDIMRDTSLPITSIIRHKLSEASLREGFAIMLRYQAHLASVIESGDEGRAEATWRRYVEQVAIRFFELIPRDMQLAEPSPRAANWSAWD